MSPPDGLLSVRSNDYYGRPNVNRWSVLSSWQTDSYRQGRQSNDTKLPVQYLKGRHSFEVPSRLSSPVTSYWVASNKLYLKLQGSQIVSIHGETPTSVVLVVYVVDLLPRSVCKFVSRQTDSYRLGRQSNDIKLSVRYSKGKTWFWDRVKTLPIVITGRKKEWRIPHSVQWSRLRPNKQREGSRGVLTTG